MLTAFERLSVALQERFPLVLVGMAGWNNNAMTLRLTPLLRKGVVKRLGYLSHSHLVNVVAGARQTRKMYGLAMLGVGL